MPVPPELFRLSCVAFVVFALAACTWVKPTPEGEVVRVAGASAVASCTRLGAVKVSLKHKLGRVERKSGKVATELQTLARNEAAVMGGDVVVAQSPVTEGRQEFGVYDCRAGQ